ncbi:bacitracin ABC transporter ATP-binding protein [Priestia aryabhattai]|uniref:ABC transporter ATP-binding protein n=1 Tax=Bacillaceae TaxID=186817 RepID=UPI000BA1403D|nr:MULTISPECIES: ABC transporter ATP-binding protein [Bacillaceae]MDT2047140.1 ABC transporter ATP-binding protein [Priestia flexa]OZT14280.1 bacitracin ABC transporter ATP-binding protein [Priestia aryabhattai]TDB54906.1 ABC transporter ATP-binding protein [Bacillus sp. CBEL-1]USY56738.1 ABC transporter ATP-binding protein [Bacillus sp. 1780r2a1]
MNIIKTSQLVKEFKGKAVVNKIDLTVSEGEIYGFLGPNGAGKTTTIRMLLGLMKPTSGSIELFGRNINGNHLHSLRQIGSLVESPSYYAHLTARENLEVLRMVLQVPKARINEVLSIVNLSKYADQRVSGFSLGMKQRLGIAASLLGNPKLLILDEPTNGLDPAGIHEIRDLIKHLPKEHGVTVLISSHLLYEIDQIATQVGIITHGQMIYSGSIESLRQKAKKRIWLNTSDENKTKSLLLASGCVPTYENNRIFIPYMENEKVASAIRNLVQNGISIYRVGEQEHSLEDIFLQLTTGGIQHATNITAG